jgi:hypothetical protein
MKAAFWVALCLISTLAHAQDADERLTVPLQIASSPKAFDGRRLAVLCTMTKADVKNGHCPAYNQIGRYLGFISINLQDMSEADRFYILSRCSAKDFPTCTLRIAGTLNVSQENGLSLSEPRLKPF